MHSCTVCLDLASYCIVLYPRQSCNCAIEKETIHQRKRSHVCLYVETATVSLKVWKTGMKLLINVLCAMV